MQTEQYNEKKLVSNEDTNTLNIIFVCTGNTCRSCMAEGIFRAFSQQKESLVGAVVSSRGIQAFDGDPASLHSVEALKKLWGIDISIHKARLLSQEDMNKAGLILTMTRQHRDFLRSSFPRKKSIIYTLKEYAYPEQAADGRSLDITDPFGMPYESYEACAREIYDSVQRVISHRFDIR